jgi:nitrogen fixation protein NifB
MKPVQAVEYLSDVMKRVSNIAVVGIAGPGDPFANPEETLETLKRVRAAFPDILLCVSSNGLLLAEHVSRLAALNVSHVTITVNAVDPEVGANVYEWFYYNKKMYYGREGAGILLDKQTQAIRLLKKYGIIVKINTVVIPRVNLHHIADIAQYVSKWGADIQNCIPLIPVAGTPYESLEEPSPKIMRVIRAQTSLHIKQMSHCARCRADAVGLLGDDISGKLAQERQVRKVQCDFLKKPYIAAASSDGLTVNQHLGKATLFWIYRLNNGTVECVETRRVPAAGCSTNRWDAIAELIPDCSALLVSGLGRSPYERLQNKGILVESVDGTIRHIAEKIFANDEIPLDVLRLNGECSGACEN